ncbi:MAG: hypothetical protein S4CHLAM2_11880 [Chlamydiales bacterium]|nr:hypothetical protein [Chlamydiales bacterium]
MKKALICIGAFALLYFLLAPRLFQVKADPFDPLPTEYTYSEERLAQLRSTFLITVERIDKWEAPLQRYFKAENVSYIQQTRFYTYLYMAQRDATFLSYNVHRCFFGTLDPLTEHVVTAFFPAFSDYPALDSDAYSEALADQVWPPYQARLEKEKSNPHRFSPCTDQPIAEKIQAIAQWLPWQSSLPEPHPPEGDLEEQIRLMRGETRSVSDDAVYAWASERGMQRDWRTLANEYMQEAKTPIGKTVYVRSKLMRGLYDTLIATFEAKFRFCVPRPARYDTSVHPMIHDPSSPSYPSGHAAQAGAAVVILTHYFPKASAYWEQLGQEATQSRIQSGVHTPQDAQAGWQLGEEMGTQLLK